MTTKINAPHWKRAALALAVSYMGLAFATSDVAWGQDADPTPAVPQTATPATEAAVPPAPAAPTSVQPAAAPAAQGETAPAPVSTDAAVQTPPAAPPSAEAPASDTAPMAIEPAPAEAAHGVSAASLPRDLSPWNMFMSADIVVKAVMIGLAFASVVTWTVWLAKSLELALAKSRLKSAFRAIHACSSLAEATEKLGSRRGLVAGFVDLAKLELRLSAGIGDKTAVKERVASRLDGLAVAAGRDINTGTGVLATIGSTAPFVGLFGTVWGIMNSFIGISESQTTNLAIVAPGIAEALLATAIGLVAAIPAVIVYNMFARSISSYKGSIAEASAEVQRLVSRDLDRGDGIALVRAAE